MLMMRGRVFDAETAERQGLAHKVAELGAALAEAVNLAHEVSGRAAFERPRQAGTGRCPGLLEEVLACKADARALVYGTADFQEGRTELLEMRRPNFEGR
jgi:2-(1,2-epoxy-1,2-dihydrophenyl)acetyl-CoA isomerase